MSTVEFSNNDYFSQNYIKQQNKIIGQKNLLILNQDLHVNFIDSQYQNSKDFEQELNETKYGLFKEKISKQIANDKKKC